MRDRETADEVRRWLRYATAELAAAQRHIVDNESVRLTIDGLKIGKTNNLQP